MLLVCCMSAAADALARGAKVLEEQSPADATALYLESIEMYENDGKEAQVRTSSTAAGLPNRQVYCQLLAVHLKSDTGFCTTMGLGLQNHAMQQLHVEFLQQRGDLT